VTRVTRIESEAFYGSSLQSIEIPRNVRFIDGSAFCSESLSSITIESGNNRFVVENDLLIDIVCYKLVFDVSRSWTVTIPNDIEILGSSCFEECLALSSITFEANSRLTRIESKAFSKLLLQSILIPRSVEILYSECFFKCQFLSSISFESNSRLTRIESKAFSKSLLQSILIPQNVEILCSKCFTSCKALSSISFESHSQLKGIESHALDGLSCRIIFPCNILFGASDMDNNPDQLSFAEGNLYEKYDGWLRVRRSGIVIDFRHILRVD
jgi:hypothetical protein